MKMWGGRKSLGVRSLQAKIEERVLRRIGHVLGMADSSHDLNECADSAEAVRINCDRSGAYR